MPEPTRGDEDSLRSEVGLVMDMRSARLDGSSNADRYFFSRGAAAVASAGVEPPGTTGEAGAGAFFGFFASLLPR